jgi:hypothetical protein
MGDQRRRGGRGRSGRGGRIPRKGDAPAGGSMQDEAFVSFPLDMTVPIRVPSILDHEAVQRSLAAALAGERRQMAALDAVTEQLPDTVLSEIRAQVDRHREALEQLGRELGADAAGAAEAGGPEAAGSLPELAAAQRTIRLAWLTLQRLAYASGDKRIHRAVNPILREKDRHSRVLESYALRSAARPLFRDPEE